MCVPTCRFHLDMLANHIETEIFRLLYIIQQSLVCGSCIQSVGPPTLVQRSKLEQSLVIQFQAYDAIRVTTGGVLTHGSIAVHLIHYLASAFQSHFQRIEEGGIRTPQLGIPGHGHLHRLCIDTFAGGYQLIAVIHIHFHKVGRACLIQFCLHCQHITVNIGSNTEVLDMFSGNRLHPYRLPDTAYGSVPDTFRIADLLSTGLRPFIRWVPNFYDQLIIAFARKGGSNIERERSKSPRMAAYFHIIHPYIRFPVDSTKVQQHLFSLPGRRNFKTALVDQFLVFIDSFSNSGQGGFDGKRNKYLPFELCRKMLTFIYNGIIPQSVQVLPVTPFHDGTRIFGQHIRGIDLGCPVRFDFITCRLPLRRASDCKQRQE